MKCSDLHSGLLRHSVTFREKVLSKDAAGGINGSQAITVATVRAKVIPVGSRESYKYGKLNATVSHVIYCRFRDDVKADMTVVYGGRELQIRGVLDLEEKHRWLEITCEDGVAT
ncbi:MAG: phage head closure protein [Chlorobiaceae bacterium]|nr:phage head closure protein [Chlorobiaceae bacterium]